MSLVPFPHYPGLEGSPEDEAVADDGHPWPESLAPEAFHGLAGEIVRKVEPETEADPAALLFQLLAAVGNILGPGAYARVEGDRHPRAWPWSRSGAPARAGRARAGTASRRCSRRSRPRGSPTTWPAGSAAARASSM
jgi:hypothetical protein